MVAADEDLYALLQVPPDASQEEIAAAYGRLRDLYSPERLQGGPAEFEQLAARRREELQQAYAVLQETARRAAYD
ncbi:MAG: DnaJ domain-containing protein, partial [Chloroflexota bacterium]|nr:DnaJ domain-containing protein [Chloroflexota bacterium]